MNSTNSSSLPRVLGPWMATAIVVGTVIGSGVFKKPFAVARDVPHFGLAMSAWVLVGVLAAMGALALAEVATLFPRAGGNYVFLREGYGRLAGFLWGWVDFWIIRTGSIAALASVFAESVHDVLRQLRDLPTGAVVLGFWTRQALTVALIVVLTLINIRGVRWSGALQFVVTSVKVLSLLAIVVLPFAVVALVSAPEFPPSTSNFAPVWPDDWSQVSWSGFGKALVGVIWAYHGWMNIAPIAEEVKRPQRNLPLALLLGVGIVIVLYLGANLGYYLVIPGHEMKLLPKDTTVATEFVTRLLGSRGGILVASAIALSVLGACNGNILVGPRLLYAMGEDGLAPRWLHAVHSRWQTPAAATIVMSAWSIGIVLIVATMFRAGLFGDPNTPGSKAPFDVITDFAMFGAVALETLAVLAIFVFRRTHATVERSYRCPGYPVVPAVYGFIMLLVWLNMFVKDNLEAWVGLTLMAMGAGVYLVFLRAPSTKSTA